MIQGKRAQAGKVHLTSKAVTIIKGQYAFIGLKGTNSKVKWRVAGGNIKIHETSSMLKHGIWSNLNLFSGPCHLYLAPE